MIGIVHKCRMHWPPGHRGIQFAVHLSPGWSSLHEDGGRWRHNLAIDFIVWRVDIGIGRDD